MPIDTDALWQQVALGEDTDLELKAVRFRGGRVVGPPRENLADELAAFANGRGGRLVLGVSDDRRPQALDPGQLDALANLVTEVCSDSVKPPLDFSIFRVPAPGGAAGGALVVELPESVTVHGSPGGHWRRRGDTKRQMDATEVRRLSQARGQSDAASTDTQVARNTGINSLSPALWGRYVSTRSGDQAEVALSKLKFLKDDRHGALRATVGGVLLAAEDPREWLPNAWIQAVCYRGDRMDASRQLDALDVAGPLDEQIREAVRFVVRNRRVAAYKDPARVDVPQFSERAVFEAVVNAVVHRDYAVSGSRIRLFLFADRLELYSPGGLCNSMTPDDLRTSQFTRNELLASRLGQCPVGNVPGAGGRRYFIERRGEGVGVIQDETFALAGEPPVFELIGERELKLVLPAARLPLSDGVEVRVSVRRGDTGAALPDAHVLLIYPNRTCREAHTDAAGAADFRLYARLPVTVLCAAKGFLAEVAYAHPFEPVELRMRPAPDGGSVAVANQTGHVSGIRGSLHVVLDELDRAWLHADSVAINEGAPQPVRIDLNQPVHLTDSQGARAKLWFREIIGASCVFDYRYTD